jgi:hypothetical protein
VEVAVAVEIERVERVDPGLRSVPLADGDRPVERDHVVRTERVEQVVELDDLRPIGGVPRRRGGMDGGNRRLDLIRPRSVATQQGADDRMALLDEPGVPT